MSERRQYWIGCAVAAVIIYGGLGSAYCAHRSLTEPTPERCRVEWIEGCDEAAEAAYKADVEAYRDTQGD